MALPPEPTARRRTRPGARARRLASRVLTVAVVAGAAAWAVFLRPPFLGGETTYAIVSGTSMEPTLHAGDLVVARRRGAYRVGDVVVYAVRPEGAATDKLIVHRIVGGSASEGYVLQGDNRGRRDAWRPTPDDVRGRLALRIPALGVVLTRLQQPRFLTAAIAGVLVFLLVTAVAGDPRRGRRRAGGEPDPGDERLTPPLSAAVRTAPATAAPSPSPSSGGYLVLARAAEAYALVERSGEPPAPGGLIVLDGRLFEVSGAALSPLPSDPRLCVLADRLAKLP